MVPGGSHGLFRVRLSVESGVAQFTRRLGQFSRLAARLSTFRLAAYPTLSGSACNACSM